MNLQGWQGIYWGLIKSKELKTPMGYFRAHFAHPEPIKKTHLCQDLRISPMGLIAYILYSHNKKRNNKKKPRGECQLL